jgi:hypothetical protein
MIRRTGIRRTGRGDIITNRHMHSTRQWFHFPPGIATRCEFLPCSLSIRASATGAHSRAAPLAQRLGAES